MRFMLTAFLMLAAEMTAHAQEYPLKFFNLLEPGQIVAYSSSEGVYRLSIASEEAYRLHTKAKKVDIQEMLDTEPTAVAALKEAQEKLNEPAPGYRYTKSDISMRPSSAFRKIVFVGQDYVMWERFDPAGSRSAIPFHRITSISWLQETPSIYIRRRLERIPEEVAKADEDAVAQPDDKYSQYAKRIISRYDKNRSGSLEAGEWKTMLMSPQDADSNRDGKITSVEYSKWFRDRQKNRASAP